MIRFLFTNLKGRRLIIAAAIVLTFAAVAADVLMAIPLKLVLDKVVDHRDPDLPLAGTLISAFDRLGSPDGPASTGHTQLGVILFAGAMALTLGVVGAAVSFVQLRIGAFVGQDLGARLRRRLFVHLEHLPLRWHGRQRVGDIVQRISGNVTEIEKLVTDGLVNLLSGILTLLGILIVMLAINWQFTLLSMCIAPPLFVIVVLYTRWIKLASKETARAAGQVAQVGTESVNAIAEIKAFTLEKWAADAFDHQSERQRRSGLRAGLRQAEFNPLVTVLIAVSNAVIITAGAWVATGHAMSYSVGFLTIPTDSLTIGSLTVFLAYSKLLYQPMRNLSKLMLLASTGARAAERIQEIIDEPVEQPLRALAAPAPDESVARRPRTAGVPARTPSGDVVFSGVVFGYGRGSVLRGVDLDVPLGTRLALVGLSGSGKTTLVRLLPRFYELCDGGITIGGVDVRDWPLAVLRRNIGFVMQDSMLFEGTIRENIALGRPDATAGEIQTAVDQASLREMIAALPNGYATPVYEQGRNFSSGQRQRIAIARAFLRDAPILILDEPTANLDVEAEAEVMDAIERLTVGRTVIMISHRLSTLGQVDEIAVLHAGTIAERGTYGQLRDAGGLFARLAEKHRRPADAHGSDGARRPPLPGPPVPHPPGPP
ncbi:ABC transporter ATP-binding protein [Sphaerisporangium sp. NPDC051017]|uniref:ABC transporter ATP-binding protein n=1 Tax=Sphaerisporangium sp. NPDC051017 TaxID=3154636 RepID=UPI00341B2CC7